MNEQDAKATEPAVFSEDGAYVKVYETDDVRVEVALTSNGIAVSVLTEPMHESDHRYYAHGAHRFVAFPKNTEGA